MPGTDLMPLSEYAIASRSDAMAEVMRENVGQGGMTVFDLDRVKIPTGGGKLWTVPGLAGEEDVRTIDGIIVAWSEPRAFWATTLDDGGGGNPPDCSSTDGQTGRGMYGVGSDAHPSGDCSTCPMSQWGSKGELRGDDARGQACKQMRLLFMLRRDDLLPLAMFLPPTSIGPVRKYFMRLASKGVPYYGVVTTLGLDQTKNATNIEYSIVTAEMAGPLSDEDRASVKAYAESIQESLRKVERDFRRSDYDDSGAPPAE